MDNIIVSAAAALVSMLIIAILQYKKAIAEKKKLEEANLDKCLGMDDEQRAKESLPTRDELPGTDGNTSKEEPPTLPNGGLEATDKENMEQKEKEIINPEHFKKEFAFLDVFQPKLNFGIFTRDVYCESNFYETMAWYIETQKEAHPLDWDEKVQLLVNDILSHDNDLDRFKYIYRFFFPLKIEWYMTHGWETNANSLKLAQLCMDTWDSRWTPDDQGKIEGILPGIVEPAIPQWYWTWFDGNELEKKVMAHNRYNFARDLRKVYNRNNGMTDEEYRDMMHDRL